MMQVGAIYTPNQDGEILPFDRWLGLATALLLLTGLLMIVSASMDIAQRDYSDPFFFAFRQAGFLFVSLVAAVAAFSVPVRVWQRYGGWVLLLSIFLLCLVFIPGLGLKVKGSNRWINMGVTNFQPSELAKLGLTLYLAGYLTRFIHQVRTTFWGILKPIFPLAVVGFLLYQEPDFGSLVLVTGTVIGMVFLSGMSVRHLVPIVVVLLGILVLLVAQDAYRAVRLEAYLDPWQDPFDSGYQLAQAQIAFGRGGWFGTGLGNSVQKLFFLPEAHTDFVFSVLAEELGYIGGVAVIVTYCLLVVRVFMIGRFAERREKLFAAFYCYGVAILLSGQALFNIGVNVGALPTKGLTLPLVSYGGSSLLLCCVMLAIVYRIDFEQRRELVGLSNEASGATSLFGARKKHHAEGAG